MSRRPGQTCPRCGRTGHCLADDCCCRWSGHVRGDLCESCGHGDPRDVEPLPDAQIIVVDDYESLDGLLQQMQEFFPDSALSGLDNLDRVFINHAGVVVTVVDGSIRTVFPEELSYPVRIMVPVGEYLSALMSGG